MRFFTSVGLATVYGVFGMTVVYVLGTIPLLAAFVEAAGTQVSTVAWVFGLAGAGLGLYQGLEARGPGSRFTESGR